MLNILVEDLSCSVSYCLFVVKIGASHLQFNHLGQTSHQSWSFRSFSHCRT